MMLEVGIAVSTFLGTATLGGVIATFRRIRHLETNQAENFPVLHIQHTMLEERVKRLERLMQ